MCWRCHYNLYHLKSSLVMVLDVKAGGYHFNDKSVQLLLSFIPVVPNFDLNETLCISIKIDQYRYTSISVKSSTSTNTELTTLVSAPI